MEDTIIFKNVCLILFDNLISALYNGKKGFNNGKFFLVKDSGRNLKRRRKYMKKDFDGKVFHQMYGAENSERITQQEKTEKDSFPDSALCSDIHCRSAV